MKTIDSFRSGNFFLSNFCYSPIVWKAQPFDAVENAFQAAKTHSFGERRIFSSITAAHAKKEGRKVTLREDWPTYKLVVMERLLKLKFEIPEFKNRLLKTEGYLLVEGNTWHDYFWGVCNEKGSNHLGRLLMKIREGI